MPKSKRKKSKFKSLVIDKKRYDNAGGELKAQLKVEWDNKTKEIAAIIRRECGKEHGTVTNMLHKL